MEVLTMIVESEVRTEAMIEDVSIIRDFIDVFSMIYQNFHHHELLSLSLR
ncbi:hypothetical protein Syun_012690 [Stephania yunnanensis]|uniref:Uncharacterized protein n=1 Tax=Stephania yunnanensis TaxID=152371 RepID=A0AAP0PJ66_9MAGN